MGLAVLQFNRRFLDVSFSFFFLFFLFLRRQRSVASEQENRRSSCDNPLEGAKYSPQAENSRHTVYKQRNHYLTMKVTIFCSALALFLAVWTEAAPVENGEINLDSAKGIQRSADYGVGAQIIPPPDPFATEPPCCTKQMKAAGVKCYDCLYRRPIGPSFGAAVWCCKDL